MTVIRYAFILGLICFLSSGALAVVNGITEPKIRLEKEEKEGLGLKEVMSGAFYFEPKLEDGKLSYYLAYNKRHKIEGFVIRAETKGYSSDIELLVSLNVNLDVVNIKILSQNETPGLGNRIADASFLSKFQGQSLETLSQVQTITGATISSLAVTNAIKNKISELRSQLLKEARNAG